MDNSSSIPYKDIAPRVDPSKSFQHLTSDRPTTRSFNIGVINPKHSLGRLPSIALAHTILLSYVGLNKVGTVVNRSLRPYWIWTNFETWTKEFFYYTLGGNKRMGYAIWLKTGQVSLGLPTVTQLESLKRGLGTPRGTTGFLSRRENGFTPGMSANRGPIIGGEHKRTGEGPIWPL